MACVVNLLESFVRWASGSNAKTGKIFYSGLLEPVDEIPNFEVLNVIKGEIPADFPDGLFCRNGPNPKFPPKGGYHLFDGDGMLHSTYIRKGRATYNNRYVQTLKLQQEIAAGRPILAKVGDLRGFSGLMLMLVDKLRISLGLVKMNPDGVGNPATANTAIEYHAGKILALSEGDVPYHVRMVCEGILETVGQVTFGGKLSHPVTAHPKLDPDTKELACFGYRLDKAPWCTYSEIDAHGNLKRSVEVPLRFPVMMHDFCLTKSYAIFMDLPLRFDPQIMVKEGKIPFRYDKEAGSRIGLLKRGEAAETEEMQWFALPGMMIMHAVNAWEEGTLVKMYVCRNEDFDLELFKSDDADLTQCPDAFAELYEITLDTTTGHCWQRNLLPDLKIDVEFPRVHPALVGRKTRYAYISTFQGILVDGVMKVDLSQIKERKPDGDPKDLTKEKEKDDNSHIVVGSFKYPPNWWAGEAIFVPKNEDATSPDVEDDGYLVSYVHDKDNDQSYLWIMDAKTLSGEPLAQISLPQRVPYGFHAQFIRQSDLDNQVIDDNAVNIKMLP